MGLFRGFARIWEKNKIKQTKTTEDSGRCRVYGRARRDAYKLADALFDHKDLHVHK